MDPAKDADRCPQCSQPVQASAQECPHCGIILAKARARTGREVSTQAGPAPQRAQGTPYRIKRGEEEYQLSGLAALKEAARTGRLLPSDYILNPVLDRWMYARDLAELEGDFGEIKKKEDAKHANKMSWAFFLASLLVGILISPTIGAILFLVAIVFAVMVYVKK